MADDVLESFESPRTIRYFSILLTITVLLLVFGMVLSQVYGFTLLENFIQVFAKSPMLLLELAGLIAFFALMIKAVRFISHI